MKFHKNVLVLFLLLFIPLVNGANINGWGSESFFGYQQQYTSFNTNFQDGFNQSIMFGSDYRPVVCNIDTSTFENELVVYSGTTVKLYSGVGNKLTELGSYTANSAINSIGCLDNYILIGTDTTYEQILYDGSNLYTGVANNYPSYDVSCNYPNLECRILVSDGVVLFETYNDQTSGYVAERRDNSLSYVQGDVIQYGNDDLTYIYDSSAHSVVFFNTSAGADLTSLDSRNVDSTDGEDNVIFGDFGSDGNIEFCNRNFVNQATDYYELLCYDADNNIINGQLIYTGSGISIIDEANIAIDIGDGFLEVCSRIISPSDSVKCYEPYSDAVRTVTGDLIFESQFKNSGFFDTSSGNFRMLAQGRIYENTTIVKDFNFGDSYTIVADITGDNKGEIIMSKLGETLVVFDKEIDTGVVPPTITFANNVIDGGFFGYYTGDVCTGTTLSFKAQECIGDLDRCNYYNSNTNENERLKTACGQGLGDSIGSFDSNNPSVDCDFNSEGDYEVVIFIQDSSLLNTSNNANVPINIHVEDSANCNLPNDFLNQPNQNISIPTEDTGSGTPPTEPSQPTEPEEERSKGEVVLDRVVENLLFIVGLILVFSMVAMMYFYGVKNLFILTLTALFALVIANILGLIPWLVTIFLVIATLLIGLVVGFVFKNQRV